MSTTVNERPAAPSLDRKPPFFRRYQDVLLGIAGAIIVLVAWQISAAMELIDVRFISSPAGIFTGLGKLHSSGNLWPPTLNTLQSVGIGMGISVAAGVPLGLIIGRSRIIHGFVEPLIGIMYSVPFAVFLPIIIFWFGIGSYAKVVLVIWAALFPLLVNVIAGGRNLPADYLQVSRVFSASRIRTLWSVALPGTMPYILAGVRQAVGRSLVGAIVAELFIGGGGLGYVVQAQTANFQMDNAMAAIAVIAVIAVLLIRGVAFLENKLTFWSAS